MKISSSLEPPGSIMLAVPGLFFPCPKDVGRSIFKLLVYALRQQLNLFAGEYLLFPQRVQVLVSVPSLHTWQSSLGLAIWVSSTLEVR